MTSADEGLRRRAIERLGTLGPELARDALEAGVIEVEHDVLAWEGSHGQVHGHRVVLWLEPSLCSRVREVPSVIDALTAALASAITQTAGTALAELAILPRIGPVATGTPYRGQT